MSSLASNIKNGMIWQLISVLSSFLLIPLGINYLGNNEYALWIVLYSVIMILNSCDLGIPSSCRNLLTKYLTRKDYEKAKEVISTSYAILIVLSLIIFINFFLYVKYFEIKTLNFVSTNYLIVIFSIVLLDYILKLILTIYTSHQKSHVLQLASSINNVMFLVVVFFLNYNDAGQNNKLLIFSCILPISSLLTSIGLTIYGYVNIFKNVKPKLSYVRKKYVSKIINFGLSFFIIQISMVILTQYSTILIFEYSTNKVVTDIAILEKFFGIISVVGAVILFPFWSKFTEKYEKKEYEWIRSCIKKLELLFLLVSLLVILIVQIFPLVLKVWMMDSNAEISKIFSILIAIKYLMILLNSIYSYYLNGIGKLNIQIFFYLTGSVSLYVFSNSLFESFGVKGLIIYSIVFYFILAISQKIYIYQSLKGMNFK